LRKILALLFLCSLPIVPALAANVILYDSTGNVFSQSTALNICPCAISFSAPGFASNLIDVQVNLTNHVISTDVRAIPLFGPSAAARTAPAAAVGSLSVALYSNNATGPQPGSLLTALGSTLFDSSLTSSPALYDFPPSSPFPLTPSARYWAVITTASSIAAIGLSNSTAGTGVAGQFSFAGSTTFPNNSSGSVLALVVATPTTPGIPVPPSVTLTLIGLASVGFYVGGRRFAGAY